MPERPSEGPQNPLAKRIDPEMAESERFEDNVPDGCHSVTSRHEVLPLKHERIDGVLG